MCVASSALPPTVGIYRAEIGAATDVLAAPSMRDAAVIPMSKTLASRWDRNC